MWAQRSNAHSQAGPSNGIAQASRRGGASTTQPVSPSYKQQPARILVVATIDSERYTSVDITDILNDGATIRSRILAKLGIWDQEDQASSLIYETQFGSLAIGQPLTNTQLSLVSRQRGDSRASLAFLVQRPQRTRNYAYQSNLNTPVEVDSESDISPDRTEANDVADKRRRRAQKIVQNRNYDPSIWPSPDAPGRLANFTSSRDSPNSSIAPPRTLRSYQSTDVLRRGGVRPLPPIPTPTSAHHGLRSATSTYFNPLPQHSAATNNFSRSSNHRNNGNPNMAQRYYDPQSNNLDISGPMSPSDNRTVFNTDSTTVSRGRTSFTWKRGNLIGTGKYGPVYMALDHSTKNIIAVKQIEIPHDSVRLSSVGVAALVETLKKESEVLQGLDHPNIVKYLHLEETSTVLNIFMEYVPGGTIRSCLMEYGKFAEQITKSFASQVLDGLAYLHSKQLVHRDLKADNILVQTNGRCKISDFAISKHADNDGFVFTALQGSVFWMAPEVINTEKQGYNSKVDIWSFGCLVFEMWTGARPWAGTRIVDVMMKLYTSKLPPPLPEGIQLTNIAQNFSDKCFAMDPNDRPTASELQTHPYLTLLEGWKFTGFQPESLADQNDIQDSEKIAIKLLTISPVLQRGLGGFHIYSSKEDTPGKWLDACRGDLLDYILNSNLTNDDEILCNHWAKNSMIYERFTTYVYEHMKIDSSSQESLIELKGSMDLWTTWDPITAILNHHVVGDRLRSLAGSDAEDQLQEIIALDVDAMCARLYVILHDAEQYKKLFSLTNEQSQVLLNLLQTLLDSPSLDPYFRSSFMNALLRLSRKSGLYPGSLLQDHVILEGDDAVAAGQFGDVWQGTYEGQKVAVKVLKFYMQSDLTKHLKKVLYETLIWRQLRHCNVLPFLCLHHLNNNRTKIGLVSPWMKNGNVRQFLQESPDANRVALVRDVAEGLEYLHSMQPSIIHGDLKAVNILITDTHRACLADFGLSTASESQVLDMSSFSMGKAGGTSRWTAPELLDGSQLTNDARSDVYAFGCVCYEIFSGVIPFHDINSDYPVILKVIQGQRPPRPSYCEPRNMPCESIGLDDSMWHIVEDCWTAQPGDRPSMSNVITRLPLRTIRTSYLDMACLHPPDQALIPWAISAREARTPIALPDS